MPAEVTCSACGAPLQIPEGLRAPWVECPRCRSRVVNPHALRLTGPVHLTGAGILGMLLLLLGICGSILGCGLEFAEAYKAAMHGPASQGRGFVLIICCLFLFASGMMLLRAGEGKPRRLFLFVAAGLGVLAAVTLLITSGLIVILATCLAGK
jgi:hypothetical protein